MSPLYKGNQISDDAHASAALCGVLVMIAVQSEPASSRGLHSHVSLGAVAGHRAAGDLAVSGRVHSRIKIGRT